MAIKISTYNLDSISYTPLYSPTTSNDVEIINNSSVAMKLRSDPLDSGTEITLLPGESKPFRSYKNHQVFSPAEILIHAILASSTGTVKVIAH